MLLDIIVGYSGSSYDKFISVNEHNLKKLRYNYYKYYGSDELWQPKKYRKKRAVVPAPHKPECILEHIKKTSADYVMWLDADAIIVDSIDELLQYDLGVVTHRQIRTYRKGHFVNSGVVIFRNIPKIINFIELWASSIKAERDEGDSSGDQYQLNALCGINNYTKFLKEKRIVKGKKKLLQTNTADFWILEDGLEVKLWPGEIYNCPEQKRVDKVKIHHFYGRCHRRNMQDDAVLNFLI